MNVICKTIFFSVLASCITTQSLAGNAKGSDADKQMSEDQQVSVEDNNLEKQFSLKLFSKIAQENPDKNIFLSPEIIREILLMLAEGGTVSAREKIYSVVGQPSDYSVQADQESSSDPQTVFNRASVFFGNKDVNFYPSYHFALKQKYDAEIQTMNFTQSTTLEKVNQWASDKTEGRIESILEELPADASFVLANALYFKGMWTDRFDPKNTYKCEFHQANGEEIDISMMSQSDLELAYREDDSFQAVEMPYGNGFYKMLLILPKEKLTNKSLNTLLNKDSKWFDSNQYGQGKGSLKLPRFTLNFRTELLDILKALNLKEILEKPDSFSGISTPAPQISQILQSSMITVNEEGSEAAAVTAVVSSRSFEVIKEFDLTFDKPFIFAIKVRNKILFVGQMTKPVDDSNAKE